MLPAQQPRKSLPERGPLNYKQYKNNRPLTKFKPAAYGFTGLVLIN